MQDYLTKYPKIDVVWCQDDDMAVGVLQAIEQAGRTDIQYVIAGAGSKDMIKKVMDGDKMIPVDVLYPPAMVGTAMEMTVAALLRPGSGSRRLHDRCDAGDQGQCGGVLLPRFSVLI
jgi:ribose transport system substrate-binding protein